MNTPAPAPASAPAPPLSLADLQQRFALALLPGTPVTALDTLYRELGGAQTVHPDARLAVYRTNAIGGQIRALEQTYPACLRVLGEPCFRTLASDYLQRHPSTDPDLNRHGGAFPAFLAQVVEAQSAFASYAYLSDLAALEWAWQLAYHAGDPAAFDWDQLPALSTEPEHLCFEPRPGLTLLHSPWPLIDLRRGSGDYRAPEPALRLCIYRRGLEPEIDLVDDELFTLMGAIAGGATLGELAGGGYQVQRIGELLQRQWIVAASLRRAEPPR